MQTVYNENGEYLGDEFVDLSTLSQNTIDAILHMIYLDETLNDLNERDNINQRKTLEIVDSCFNVYASSSKDEAKKMAKKLLDT